eukprot:2230994-Rhodomonas_salina.2
MPLCGRRQIRGMGRRGPKASVFGQADAADTGSVLVEQKYCAYDEAIDRELTALHDALRRGVPNTQLEIDTYLFAAGPPLSCTLPASCLRMSILNVVSFETLPNIQERVTKVLLASETDNSISAQFLRQCLPLKRRTKRAQRDITWTPHHAADMRVFVRCAYGTLLGLYPSCSKFAHFNNRVALNSLLHSVLVGDVQVLTTFCNKLSYILRIALMEHCCQTISTFSPGLVHTLNKKKQFFAFCNTMYSVGDSFRADLNKMQLPVYNKERCFEMLMGLEDTAQTLFDRCSRAFRTVISTPPTAVVSSQARRTIMKSSKVDG